MWIRHALLIVVVKVLCQNVTLAQELKVNIVAVRDLVSRWNAAHSASRVETLSSLYSDTVNFYGSLTHRQKCTSIKRDALRKQKDFNQVIKTELVFGWLFKWRHSLRLCEDSVA